MDLPQNPSEYEHFVRQLQAERVRLTAAWKQLQKAQQRVASAQEQVSASPHAVSDGEHDATETRLPANRRLFHPPPATSFPSQTESRPGFSKRSQFQQLQREVERRST